MYSVLIYTNMTRITVRMEKQVWIFKLYPGVKREVTSKFLMWRKTDKGRLFYGFKARFIAKKVNGLKNSLCGG